MSPGAGSGNFFKKARAVAKAVVLTRMPDMWTDRRFALFAPFVGAKFKLNFDVFPRMMRCGSGKNSVGAAGTVPAMR